jgi:hypothetical protein
MTSQLGCSSDDTGGDDDRDDGTTTATAVERPPGPAAELAGPLQGGKGLNLVSTGGPDLAALGWVEEEYTAAGTANSYRALNDLPTDGTFELEADATADYTTRIVVRRPAQAADFNGTVVVEWLNVSGGLDAQPDYSYTADELVRGGYAWVGVSAQLIGVEGGPAAVAVAGAPTGGLRGNDPERYGALHHPGDAFAYDIYTQVAQALREPGAIDALGGLAPERLLAVGESQSAYALTTYVDGVQPLTRAFDGFLVHSRGSAAAPLGRPGDGVDMAGTIGGPPTRIRTDGDAPVLVLESETDVLGFLGYFAARQPDSERFRLWEVAGAAHADAFLLGPAAGLFDCGGPINAGPMHFVVKAALRSLDRWVRTGEAPPEAPRLEIDDRGASSTFVRDADGNARGGIRAPQVDVPVAALSGEPRQSTSVICALLGSTQPFSDARLAELYPSADDYLAAYEAAAAAAIEAGFVLEDDRDALLADAQPDVIPG